MTRKAIIVVLTLGALGSGALWGVSKAANLFWVAEGETCVVTVLFWNGAVEFAYFSCTPEQKLASERFFGPSSPSTDATVYLAFAHHPRHASRRPRTAFYLERAAPGKGLALTDTLRLRIGLPLSFLFVLFAAYPTIALVYDPLRRWRRRRKGLCVKCGYDLTGLPEPRCPECGSSVN